MPARVASRVAPESALCGWIGVILLSFSLVAIHRYHKESTAQACKKRLHLSSRKLWHIELRQVILCL